MKRMLVAIVALSLAFAGLALSQPKETKNGQARFRVADLHGAGKIDALHARFRDHTEALRETPHDGHRLLETNRCEQAKRKLVYLLAFPSQEAAAKSWKDFQADPEWKAVKEASEKDGPLSRKSTRSPEPTDYSPLK